LKSRDCATSRDGGNALFNNKRGDGSRLVISVFAKEISFSNDDDRNIVR
jgi:hypothetical protein